MDRPVFLFHDRDPEGGRRDVRSRMVFPERDRGNHVVRNAQLGLCDFCVVRGQR